MAMTVRASGTSHFRPDLEGLRGVAILLVLSCHAGIPGAEGGFVGVDVFFVLSGFLITGLLVAEHDRSGLISFRAFYARRARRILPAALVVLVVTLFAAQFIISPLDLPRITDDVLAAGLSLANIRFAFEATDYFASGDVSPVLHYWSLAVEEQFYLVWPALLLLAAHLWRPRVGMALLMTAVLAGSFLLSLAVTVSSGPWAYYSLPTRAWQLAAGGLVALAIPRLGSMPRPLAAGIGWSGVGLVAAAFILIGPATPYPGFAALLPTIGAVGIIASGGRPASPGRIILSLPPLRWLGRISYSLYLWHWPILVLGPLALGLSSPGEEPTGTSLISRLGLVFVAVIAAIASWRLIEEPFRRGLPGPGEGRRSLAKGAPKGFAAAGAALIIVGALSSATVMSSPPNVELAAAYEGVDDQGFDPASLPTGPPRATGVIVSAPGPDGQDAMATPAVVPVASSQPTPRPVARIEGRIPKGLQPSLKASRGDDDRLFADECGLSLAGVKPPRCVYGDRDGSLTVALVGDSHASHWFPALEIVAQQRGWRLIPLTKVSCVFVDMRLTSPYLKREYTECETWRENVIDRLIELQPDMVLIASNRWFPALLDQDGVPERQGAAMARFIERVPGRIAIIVDTPRSDHDVPACLAKHPTAIERCVTKRAAALTWRHLRRETEAARLTGAAIVDMTDVVCPGKVCPPIIGDTLVYRDHHHLTATFVRSIAGDLAAALPDLGSP